MEPVDTFCTLLRPLCALHPQGLIYKDEDQRVQLELFKIACGDGRFSDVATPHS